MLVQHSDYQVCSMISNNSTSTMRYNRLPNTSRKFQFVKCHYALFLHSALPPFSPLFHQDLIPNSNAAKACAFSNFSLSSTIPTAFFGCSYVRCGSPINLAHSILCSSVKQTRSVDASMRKDLR